MTWFGGDHPMLLSYQTLSRNWHRTAKNWQCAVMSVSATPPRVQLFRRFHDFLFGSIPESHGEVVLSKFLCDMSEGQYLQALLSSESTRRVDISADQFRLLMLSGPTARPPYRAIGYRYIYRTFQVSQGIALCPPPTCPTAAEGREWAGGIAAQGILWWIAHYTRGVGYRCDSITYGGLMGQYRGLELKLNTMFFLKLFGRPRISRQNLGISRQKIWFS